MPGPYLPRNDNPIIWTSKKLSFISRCTTDARYSELNNLICEIMWVVSLLS